MFDYVNGSIIHKTPTELIVEVNNIGYSFRIPLSTYERVPDEGKVKVFTKLLIKKDVELVTYGFSSLEERGLFNLLLSVNGVGPNMALTILSASSINQFKKFVTGNDPKALQRIKGIGRKTAERIILELKESIKAIVPEEVTKGETQKMSIVSDAIMALISLGYARPTAEKAVNLASKDHDFSKVEELIKESLRYA